MARSKKTATVVEDDIDASGSETADLEEEVTQETAESQSEADGTEGESEAGDDIQGEVEEQVEKTSAPAWYERLDPQYKGMDENTVLSRLAQDREQQRRDTEAVRQYQHQLYARDQQLQEFQRQQQAAQQAAAQAKATPKWEAPAYDPKWLNLVERNEKGQLVAISGADPTLPQKIQAFAEHRDSLFNNWATKGPEFLQEQVMTFLPELIQQEAQRVFEQHQSSSAINQWEEQHADILYGKGGQHGQLTDVGQEIVAEAKALGGGVQGLNQALVNASARRMVAGQREATNGTAIANKNQNGKTNFLKKAAANGSSHRPNRNGAANSETKAAAQVNRLSGSELLLQNIAESGFDPNAF